MDYCLFNCRDHCLLACMDLCLLFCRDNSHHCPGFALPGVCLGLNAFMLYRSLSLMRVSRYLMQMFDLKDR